MLGKLKQYIYKKIYSPEKYARFLGVKIGTNCFIGTTEWSSEPYLIEIGDNCAITSGVKLFTHGGARVLRKKYPDFDYFGKIIIGNDVYLGCNSLVMPGVRIADNVLVAAGSVVTKSVPPRCVVAGNPAKIICSIDEYEKNNLKYNTHSKNMNPREKKKFLLSMDDSAFILKKQM